MSSICPCCGQIVPYGTDFAGNVYVDSTTTDSSGGFSAIISSDGRVVETTLKESAVDEIKEQPYFNGDK